MRNIIRAQMQLGECDISAIAFDCFSRDDILRLLRGLRHIYTTEPLREAVFAIHADVLPVRADGEEFVSADTGRPGMSQWRILVLGTLRQWPNADYDRVQEFANQHRLVRQMLGHSDWSDEDRYSLQALKDNLRLFTPEVLERSNAGVVKAGHVGSRSARPVATAYRKTCPQFRRALWAVSKAPRSSIRRITSKICGGFRSVIGILPIQGKKSLSKRRMIRFAWFGTQF